MFPALIAMPDVPIGDNESFLIRRYGISEEMPPTIIEPHRHLITSDFLCIHFAGPFQFGSGGGLVAVPGPAVVIWGPGQPRTYGHQSSGWRHSWLHVSGTSVRSVLRRYGMEVLVPTPAPGVHRTEKLLGLMHEECALEGAPSSAILQNLFENWLLGLRRSGSDRVAIPRAGLVRARQHMESGATPPRSLPELAAEAGLSVSHFCTEFKKAFGVPPGALQRRCRVERAKYLLTVHRLRVGEVAEVLGYADAFAFSKAFRQAVGVSPSRYRHLAG